MNAALQPEHRPIPAESVPNTRPIPAESGPKTRWWSRPWPQRWNQLADHSWRYWGIHLIIAVLGAAIPVASLLLVIEHYQRTPSDILWDGMLGQQVLIPISVADVAEHEIAIPPYGKGELPPNVPLVGVAEAMGLSELRSALFEGHPRRTPKLCLKGECGRDERQLNFITVGGPSVNEMTRNLIASWNEGEKDPNSAFMFRKGFTLDAKLIVHYPSHYVEDRAQQQPDGKPKVYTADRENANGTGKIVTDYGFIVIGPNPFQNGRVVCAVFGIWPQGTQAAIEALLRPDVTNPHWPELESRIRHHQGLVAIVKTTVYGITSESPTLETVRALEPQP